MTEMLPVAACEARTKSNVASGDLVGQLVGDTQIQFAEDGEVLVSGSGLMKGYLGTSSQQWHRTGDLGQWDEGLGLVLLGRKKNMLIRGHKNIYPSLYEPALSQYAGVASAHLVGVPDEIGDDQVALFVAVENSVEDLTRFERNFRSALPLMIDGDAMPQLIIVRREIPTSGRSNKPDLDEMRKIAARELAKS